MANWDAIDGTEDGPNFKQWLINRLVTEDVFNTYEFEQIDELRTQFDKGKKRTAHEALAITIINMDEQGAGKKWKMLTPREDFLSSAKTFIAEKWALSSSEQDAVHLAIYVNGINGRIEFQDSDGYWNSTPSTNAIYFWVGEKKTSPGRRIGDLEKEMAAMNNRVKCLMATSATAKEQEELWRMKDELSIEAIEEAFPPADDLTNAVKAKNRITQGPSKAKEVGVQEMWNEAMPNLVINNGIWKDGRAPNGIQFDGRRHDIDLMLLTKDFSSILYLDTPIELKDTIASDAKRREVVLQLLDRFSAMFDGQPQRKVCWGLGMDKQYALFVKESRDDANNSTYMVSSNCNLLGTGWGILLRFLGASPVLRGFVEVALPTLWGKKPKSKLSSNVFVLEDGIACKVGLAHGILKELAVLKYLSGSASFFEPKVQDVQTETGDSNFPCGFQMKCFGVVAVDSEDAVERVAADIFWGLGVLHRLGVVHKDVKPANILSRANGSFVLGDYGAAMKWKTGESITSSATDAYSSISGEFAGTDSCMYRRDFESLYWSMFALWLQVIKKRESPGSFRQSRCIDLSVLRDRKGAFVGEGDGVLHKPSRPTLKEYLVGQAERKELFNALKVFQDLFEIEMTAVQFNTKASNMNLLPCPPEVFSWLKEQQTSLQATSEK